MEKTTKKLISKIDDIRIRMTSLRADDQTSIIEIGSALEQIESALPEAMSESKEAFRMCLDALQAIYEQSVGAPESLLQAITKVLELVGCYLATGGSTDAIDDIKKAVSALNDAFVGTTEDISDSLFPNSCEADSSTVTSLDDVASLLMQVEVDDRDGLARISKSLAEIASKESLSPSSKKLVNQAISKLDEALGQGLGVTSELLAELGELLGAAIEEMDNQELKVADDCEPQPIYVYENKDSKPSTPVSANPSETVDSLPTDTDVAFIEEFITECAEYIEGAQAALLALEVDPADVEAVNTVFRAFHTIKGTSAFLGLNSISELAHRAESLLCRVRDGEIRCEGVFADLALRSVDMLNELVQNVRKALLSGCPIKRPDGYEELYAILANPEAAVVSGESAESNLSKLGETLVANGEAKKEEVYEQSNRKQADRRQASTMERATESYVRVRTDRLDLLIDTVGEIVIAESMVAQDDVIVSGSYPELSKKVAHMGKVVRDLQYLSMSMRMVPLRPTFQKMARIVRDLAQKSGKLVDFITEGEDTEIDRNMVDLINDPLVHMVRNAVDHGIEMPDVRQSCGKPRKGTIRLSAYHSGGNVIVEMRDDGKGLNRDKIVEKAIAKGLIASDKGMSDNDVYNLIFAPGFSTAEQVTDISGRGVGLDVVKRNIEALRGRIEVSSEPGKGCLFVLRLPLTMAVTDGMLVKVGTERFILPTVNIRLSFRPDPEAITEVLGRGEMVMLRGELMPIFRLHELFNIEGAVQDPTQGLLIVVDDGERGCALLVDEILGQQRVVAKSLGKGIGKIQGISGGAILGDGRVGLILDSMEIAALARHKSEESKGGEVELRNAA